MLERSASRHGPLPGCLERARRGEAGARDALYDALRPLARQFVLRHLRRSARRWLDADDLAQEVLIETAEQMPALPPDAGVEELLRRMRRTAQLRVTDAIRKHRRLVGESVGPRGDAAAVGEESVGDVTAADRRRWMHELIGRLPEMYAVVVRLCGLEGLSCVEAGRRLGLEPDTVRKRYEHARRELQRRTRGRGDA